MKTAYDLLSDGFSEREALIKILELGETKIPLNSNEQEKLQKAIETKDYYEIKRIMEILHRQ